MLESAHPQVDVALVRILTLTVTEAI
jgi:hypothetical protein